MGGGVRRPRLKERLLRIADVSISSVMKRTQCRSRQMH
jgi:hypothetical protein